MERDAEFLVPSEYQIGTGQNSADAHSESCETPAATPRPLPAGESSSGLRTPTGTPRCDSGEVPDLARELHHLVLCTPREMLAGASSPMHVPRPGSWSAVCHSPRGRTPRDDGSDVNSADLVTPPPSTAISPVPARQPLQFDIAHLRGAACSRPYPHLGGTSTPRSPMLAAREDCPALHPSDAGSVQATAIRADGPGHESSPAMDAAAEQVALSMVEEGRQDVEPLRVQRTCIVCMSAPISTASLPCRHSTMCNTCMEEVRSQSGTCPICRAHIDYVLHGEFEAEFVDLAHKLVLKARHRMGSVGNFAYEEMYRNIRTCLILGLLSGGAAAALFLFSKGVLTASRVLGFVLAVFGIVIGYLPWFVVTVAAFERDDLPETSRGRSFCISRADCRNPLVLACKLLLMVLLGPIAVVFFFLPYLLLAAVGRPFVNRCIPLLSTCVLRVLFAITFSCFMYLRPAGVCCCWICHGPLAAARRACGLLCDVCAAVCNAVSRAKLLVSSTCIACSDAICDFFESVLRCICEGLSAVVRSICSCFEIIERCCNSLEGLMRDCGEALAIKIQSCLLCCCAPFFKTFRRFLDCLTTLLSPLGRICCSAWQYVAKWSSRLRNAVSRCCVALTDCITAALHAPLQCISHAAAAFVTNVLRPVRGAVISVLRTLQRCFQTFFRAMRNFCLNMWHETRLLLRQMAAGFSR